MIRREISIPTTGYCHIVDITGHAALFVDQINSDEGLINLFIPGSTAALTTIEFESGAVEDLRRAIERMAPEGLGYDHDARWGDGNGFSHVRAALLGPSLTVPFVDNRLLLGTWQQIVLIDFDNNRRNRTVILTAISS